MAKTASYGIGQYTYDDKFNYITWLGSSLTPAQEESYTPLEKSYVTYTPDLTTSYRDVAFELPDGIEYGNSYYMTITLPQDGLYDTTVNLKLCAENLLSNEEFKIDFNKFQQIKQLTVPASNSSADSIYSEVILFEYQNGQNTLVAADIPIHVSTSSGTYTESHLYEYNGAYKYALATDSSWSGNNLVSVTNYSSYNLAQGWKITSENITNDTITYSFVFSPKYNLTDAYKYLWIEVIHDNEDIRLSDQSQTYNGKTIPINNIEMSVYKITNLLPETLLGIASIKSGVNTLNGITITGPNTLIAAINGEEIKIGSTGQYELKDFNITSLGLVVKSIEDSNFLIDYTYAIKN